MTYPRKEHQEHRAHGLKRLRPFMIPLVPTILREEPLLAKQSNRHDHDHRQIKPLAL